MHTRTLIPLLLPAVSAVGGCFLPVPTSGDKVLAGRQIKPEQLAFLTPAVTPEADVIARLGNPDIIWQDARVFGWHWEMRDWKIIVAYRDVYGEVDIATRHCLLIQFDKHGRVRRFETMTRPAF